MRILDFIIFDISIYDKLDKVKPCWDKSMQCIAATIVY